MKNFIAVVSDVHFHSGRGVAKQVLEDEIFEAFSQVTESCLENGIEYLYILGDLFHVRAKIHTSVFNRVYDMFKEVTSKGLKIGLLSGNHDQTYNQDNKTSSIYSLQEISGVTLINWETFQHGKCNFVGIPYLNTKGEFASSLQEMTKYLQDGMINILFTHGVVSGSMIGNGYSFSKSTGVDAGLELFDKVFAGHVHIPQVLFNGKAIVTGSPLSHTKKDLSYPQIKGSPTNHDRGFWLINTDNGEQLLIPTVHTKFLSYSFTSKSEVESMLLNWNKRDFLFIKMDAPDMDSSDELVRSFTNDKIEWDFARPSKDIEIRLSVDIGASEEKIIEKFIDLKCEGFDKVLLNKIASELVEEYDLVKESK